MVAKEARRHSEGKVLISVPVDLRPRKSGTRSTANLFNSLFIEVSPQNKSDQIANEISRQIDEKYDCMSTRGEIQQKFIPLWYLESIIRKMIAKQHAAGRYYSSGVISNFGKFPLELYQGGNFHSTTGFFIPPGHEFVPAALTLQGCGDYVELLTSIPRVLASQGRLDTFMENISAGLVPND